MCIYKLIEKALLTSAGNIVSLLAKLHNINIIATMCVYKLIEKALPTSAGNIVSAFTS